MAQEHKYSQETARLLAQAQEASNQVGKSNNKDLQYVTKHPDRAVRPKTYENTYGYNSSQPATIHTPTDETSVATATTSAQDVVDGLDSRAKMLSGGVRINSENGRGSIGAEKSLAIQAMALLDEMSVNQDRDYKERLTGFGVECGVHLTDIQKETICLLVNASDKFKGLSDTGKSYLNSAIIMQCTHNPKLENEAVAQERAAIIGSCETLDAGYKNLGSERNACDKASDSLSGKIDKIEQKQGDVEKARKSVSKSTRAGAEKLTPEEAAARRVEARESAAFNGRNGAHKPGTRVDSTRAEQPAYMRGRPSRDSGLGGRGGNE